MAEDSPSVVAEVSKAQRLAQAFQAVFGQPKFRSSDQRLVYEHIRKCSGQDALVFNGDFSPYRAAQLDGARSQFLIIERQLEIARRNVGPKPKPKATKT